MLTAIGGIRVGHATDRVSRTGCTVVIFDLPTVGGIDVRGSNPGTKDTDLLRPMSAMPRIDAILLTGGSSFGLEAAFGVMRYLENLGRGHDVQVARIPIVPAAVIYDLAVGSAKVRPNIEMGLAACRAAHGGSVESGAVGAGTGARVGRLNGPDLASEGGIGTALVTLRGDVIVAALVVANAFGDVVDRGTGQILAGSRNREGEFINTYERQKEGVVTRSGFNFENTTLGIVSTNCRLTKTEANRMATIAQDGIARAVYPSHTSVDGDVVFATGSAEGKLRCPVDLLGSAAAEAIELAIIGAARSAMAPGSTPGSG